MWKLIQSKNTVKKMIFCDQKGMFFLSYNSWGRGIENGGSLKMAKVLVGKFEPREIDKEWMSQRVT